MHLPADILLPRPIGGLPQLGEPVGIVLPKPSENFGTSEGSVHRLSDQRTYMLIDNQYYYTLILKCRIRSDRPKIFPGLPIDPPKGWE